MNTNSIKKANLIDMDLLNSIKMRCNRDNKSTIIFNYIQENIIIIIIIIICIGFLSYRNISKKTNNNDDELHEQYIRYKEYKKQKKLQKKINRLEQSLENVIDNKPNIPIKANNEPIPANAYTNHIVY